MTTAKRMTADRTTRSPVPPLDSPALERLALRYVERFATTRGKLADYLVRKVRERGWTGDGDVRAIATTLADRMAELGYVDDRAYATAKAAALTRRGLGAGRVTMALRQARVGADDVAAVQPAVARDRVDSALAFARRRRIGPFATMAADRPQREKHLGAMVRAGHSFALARAIAFADPGRTIDFHTVPAIGPCEDDEPC
jgi:regulatory protein